jgi:hypothetical protein
MKWGVRKADRSATDVVVTQKKPGTRVSTSGGKNQPASEDAKNAAAARQKAKSSTTDSLSNKELQDLVRRMNLEQQYSDLMSKRSSSPLAKGQRFVKDLLGVGKTANEVVAFQNSPVGKQLKEKLDKED